MIEARYALDRSVAFFGFGLFALALNTGLLLFESSPRLLLWMVGAGVTAIGLRGLDRRVKLRVGPTGLFYSYWGAQTFLWDEFEGFAPFRNNLSWIEVRARYPEQLRSRLSLSARLDAWINAKLGRPPLYLNPSQLDVGGSEILGALAQYLPAR